MKKQRNQSPHATMPSTRDALETQERPKRPNAPTYANTIIIDHFSLSFDSFQCVNLIYDSHSCFSLCRSALAVIFENFEFFSFSVFSFSGRAESRWESRCAVSARSEKLLFDDISRWKGPFEVIFSSKDR